MKKLTAVSLLILIIFGAYIAIDRSGIVDYFTTIVNEEDGWRKTENGYVKQTLKFEWTYHYTILRDPKPKKEFQVYSGVMKKSALDRMTYVTNDVVVMKDGETYEQLKEHFKIHCTELGANTVIIDSESMNISTEVKAWSL